MSTRSSVSSPMIRKPSLFRSAPRRRTAPPLPRPLLQTLRVLIVLLVLWCEYGTFYSHASWCSFDDSPSSKGRDWDPSLGTAGGWRADASWVGAQPWHVLVVADPQLLDMRSYPGRNWLARWLGVKFTDNYARKAWRFVKGSRGKDGPLDSVVWLGDLLDSGVESVDRKEHSHYVHRFNLLFPLPRAETSSTVHKALHPPIPAIYMPGNHDLGLHLPSAALASYGRERFQEAFGPPSGEKEWGGWDVVWIDSMALLENAVEAAEAREWVERVGRRPSTRPRVLFTHIPLFRPEGTYCGRERESPRALRQGAGKNYQNEMDEVTSKWLIETLRPTIIYSGDDHDSCVINHPYFAPGSGSPVVETTVKAFSMAMGVRRPGYSLLSLYPPISSLDPSSATFTQTNCTLPDQLSIWLHVYLPLFALVTLSLLLPKLYRHIESSINSRRNASARSNGLPVHRHKKSLSRQIFAASSRSSASARGGEGGYEDREEKHADEYAEDSDSQFPTFPFSPSPNDDYGYHSGLDSDALPTSNHPSSSRLSAYDDQEAPSRVRRVSRVWLWEKGDKNPFSEAIDPSTSGRYSTRHPSSSSSSPLARLESFLNRCGPVGRWVLRPVVKMLRQAVGRVMWAPNVLGRWLGGTAVGEILGSTAAQVTEVAWPGVVAWMVVWVWCLL